MRNIKDLIAKLRYDIENKGLINPKPPKTVGYVLDIERASELYGEDYRPEDRVWVVGRIENKSFLQDKLNLSGEIFTYHGLLKTDMFAGHSSLFCTIKQATLAGETETTEQAITELAEKAPIGGAPLIYQKLSSTDKTKIHVFVGDPGFRRQVDSIEVPPVTGPSFKSCEVTF